MRIAELGESPNLSGVFSVVASIVATVWGSDTTPCRHCQAQGHVLSSEAVAEAEIQRAHELVVARVRDTCPSAVRPAISGLTVAAENTIDQTNRQIEFPKLDLGDVASPFVVHHATM